MSDQNRHKVNFYLIWKKFSASKVNLFVFLGFVVFLGIIWKIESYLVSFHLYLFLFPYLFLFFSQDMMRGEIESGCLENVIFINKSFKNYLWDKNYFLAFIAISVSLLFFLIYYGYGIIMHSVEPSHLDRLCLGLLVGLYYLALSGFLSFYLRGGSNVAAILGFQFMFFIWFLFSAKYYEELIENVEKGVILGFAAKMKIAAVIVVFPNLIILKNLSFYWSEVLLLLLLFLGLENWKINRMELPKR
ncbi:MAG: hypothetical protein ACPLZD_10505 [Candidatus Saccharicenans sp.]|nr:MAG: hypothetical protein C0168_03135 [Candidatus Aminicenantes bacterium]HEK85840.1 hypothetical protein [Candidatus Aminicenantes bacterium]